MARAMLEVTAKRGDVTAWEGDAIVVNLFKGVKAPGGATGAVDEATGGAISRLIQLGDLTGRAGQTRLLYPGGDLGAKRVLVVGLGEQEAFDLQAVRKAAAAAVKAFRGTKVKRAATIVHGAGIGGIEAYDAARAIAEASVSVSYEFSRKGKPKDEEVEEKKRRLDKLVVLEADGRKVSAVKRGVAHGVVVAQAQAFTRDMASVSGTEGYPAAIAKRVQSAVKGTGLKCRVLTLAEIKKEKMGGLLAVSQGSEQAPRFVVLEHKPKGKAKKKVCIVGKGVTFDTGGISIKPSSGMDKMRYDKSGAAATFGVLLAAAALDLPVHVIGLTPLAENMPSGKAVKPGDVITMRSGLTVDVLNTDAEGRLILADALDYAKKFKPDHTIDMATLTGAVTVALGTQAMAVMSDDEALVAALRKAGDETGERVWPLPFYKEYEKQIEGVVGDIKNTGGRPAGTITAGKFLQRFAPETGWAHLDIASTAWNEDKPYLNGDYYPEGPTGVGVRLLVRWLESL